MVQKGITQIANEERSVGGSLGRPGGARGVDVVDDPAVRTDRDVRQVHALVRREVARQPEVGVAGGAILLREISLTAERTTVR